MARVTLLHLGNGLGQRAAFEFEHMMAHRLLFAVMSPLERFSALPYLLDPMQNVSEPASHWHLNHQQAHNDALPHVPIRYGSTKLGLDIGRNLIDFDLADARQRTWWTWENEREHYSAAQTVGSTPAPPPAPPWRWPFW